MSTTIVESWATDIAQLGPIYPFVGSEGLMVILGFAAWIGWHIWQIRAEREEGQKTLDRIRRDKNSSP